MGGICAILGHNTHNITEICQRLRHRGPDDEGFHFDRNIALGHRALFTPEERESQPICSEDGRIWITFEGRIYNTFFTNSLEKNHGFRTNSSAELTIHAYEEMGPDCVRNLNGIFAFCIWDSTKGKLFCARDKLGIKPLYYHSCPERLTLASEIKALFADPLIERIPHEQAIYDYLVTGSRKYNGDTFFRGIKELLPACYMLADQEAISIQRYWNPTCVRCAMTRSDNQYASNFLEILRDSIRVRLPKEDPFGTCLSGGLDSSSIACLSAQILGPDLSQQQKLFSAVHPEEPNYCERPYIDVVKAFLETEVNYIASSVRRRWDNIRNFVYHMDEPVPVMNYLLYYFIAEKLSKHAKIAFIGQGGDALFMGSRSAVERYFRELWSKSELMTLAVEVIAGVLNRDWALILSKLFSWDVRSELRRLSHGMSTRLMQLLDREAEPSPLFDPQFLATYSPKKLRNEDRLQDATVLEINHHIPEMLQFGDRAFSAFSIEVRYPYMDHRLVEFSLSLPANQKLRNGRRKFILWNTMRGIVPDAIRSRRRKYATAVPLETWLRDLRTETKRVFESNIFRKRGYFNQSEILNVYDRLCEGSLNPSEARRYGHYLWRILNLELWLEAFIDSGSSHS